MAIATVVQVLGTGSRTTAFAGTMGILSIIGAALLLAYFLIWKGRETAAEERVEVAR